MTPLDFKSEKFCVESLDPVASFARIFMAIELKRDPLGISNRLYP